MRRLLLLSLLWAAPASAQRADAIFERANQAYFRGDYGEAVAGYELLFESGVDDPDVSYNLATANARLGRWGHAIRWYEHTLVLEPGDDDAERGLTAARASLGRRRADQRGEALVQMRPSFAQALVRPFSENALAVLLLLTNIAFFGVLIARSRTASETPRLALGIAIPLVGALLLLSAAGLGIKAGLFSEGEPAVVLVESADVREGPDHRARHRAAADEGEPARILDRHGDWVRVTLPGGREGWMNAEEVGAI